ncbi:hypothetical protein MP228_007145 [Amoeboaphelidium protococcarum]|nr:hypothetical protein MP228_007145 [Amoeboaphelidium protococcarum]
MINQGDQDTGMISENPAAQQNAGCSDIKVVNFFQTICYVNRSAPFNKIIDALICIHQLMEFAYGFDGGVYKVRKLHYLSSALAAQIQADFAQKQADLISAWKKDVLSQYGSELKILMVKECSDFADINETNLLLLLEEQLMEDESIVLSLGQTHQFKKLQSSARRDNTRFTRHQKFKPSSDLNDRGVAELSSHED